MHALKSICMDMNCIQPRLTPLKKHVSYHHLSNDLSQTTIRFLLDGFTSNGAGLLEQSGKLTLLGLEVAIATNVLVVDVNVGHGPLVGDFL